MTATFLTLVVLPILYSWLAQWQERKGNSSIGSTAIMIILPLLFFSLPAEAQQRPVTMNEAVDMALQNHPSIRAADLKIQQGQSLQNLPYTLGTTDFSYQGDGLFRENGQQVNQIGVMQNIPNPYSIKTQNSWQNEQVTQSILRKQLTEKELRLQVQQFYLDLQQRKELRQLYESLIQTYQRYAQMAKVRTEVLTKLQSKKSPLNECK